MSNLHLLNPAALAEPTEAWPGEPELDRVPASLARVAVFQIGDRVIAPPTPGAIDYAYRQGGVGEVVDVREFHGMSEPMAYVTLDDGADVAQPYRFDELRLEPTV
jgi:hypothetical protein